MTERPEYPHKYAIDFDDTICRTSFDNGRWLMGDLIPGIKEAINECAKTNEIIIYTARPIKEFKNVTRYLAEHGVVFDGIQSKILADRYVDDRALRPDEFIEKFKREQIEKSIHDEEVNYTREQMIDEWYKGEQDYDPYRS